MNIHEPSKPLSSFDLIVQLTLGLMVLVLAIVDLVGYWRYGPEFSVSRVIFQTALQHPVVPLLFGLLLGHLFWPQ